MTVPQLVALMVVAYAVGAVGTFALLSWWDRRQGRRR